ncbi:MAG TPA: NAD(P)-dependent oxidoreductase, partial [Candidatus Angelobacter sp.]|nr:NAD(P)-dependent oxidoreductase [Candidatus Angelobacter sp.]
MRVAFLGLGIMGGPMAANLVKAGHEVSVWNRTPKSIEGATTAPTPAEAVKGKEAVWVCVSDTKAVQSVLFGAQGAIHGLETGTIVVDSSTIAPSASINIMEGLQEKGCEFLDAPVTGSKVAAEAGSLIFMIGGAVHNIERVEPLLRAMGKKVIHMGENGKGLSAKLAQNMNIVFMYEGLCESLTLARKLGVAPEKMFELIEASMIRSGVAEYKKPFILNQDYTPNFPLKLMHKDIHLMLDAARENDVKLPGLAEIDKVI